MPYQNVPAELTGKMDDCVQKVMARGMEKERAIAICYASIVGKEQKSMDESTTLKAEWDVAYINDLPDSAFLYISPGGEKDEDGKTVPRNLRSFPYKNTQGNVDLPHLRNAIARIPQSDIPNDKKASLQERARDILTREQEGESEKGIASRVWDAIVDTLSTTFKVGARHNLKDNEMVQGIHDHAVSLGATCKVVKQADGSYRWVLISSSAYQDRDGEIVSQKALEADVARADAEKDYGPLLWWHESRLPLGDADFNATHGPMLIESGTFKSGAVAVGLKEHEAELGGSIAFNHPMTEPDKEGVFNTVRRFERSILPKEKASNLFTRFSVKESTDMDKEKVDSLKDKIGDEAVSAILQSAEAQTKQADAAGVRRKEEQPDGAASTAPPAADTAPVTQTTTPEAIAQAIATALAPIEAEFTGLKAALGEQAQAKATAEVERQKAVDAQTAKVTALEAQLGEAQKSLKELQGDLPRGVVKGYRASQDDSTITKDETLKASIPQADPLADFINTFAMGGK